MLLFELKKHTATHAGIPIVDVKRPPKLRKGAMGQGAQSMVYGFKTRPNDVVKIAKIDNLEDPYLKFLAAIQKSDNPFFPKIYNMKLMRYKDDSELWDEEDRPEGYFLVVQMEKLLPLSHPKLRDAAKGMLASIGMTPDQYDTRRWQQEETHDEPDPDNSDQFTWDNTLRDTFNDKAKTDSMVQRTKNPQFQDAMRILSPMFSNSEADLHQENFMVRLTANGPQLVIIDPVLPDAFLEDGW